ncbi:MAG: hypothetical protein PHP01_08050 [Phycisphaerae bacterium]|nr:hypothetical protein [Phycisphaerae bacterium]
MNKTRSLAKVLISITAIYWLILMCIQVIQIPIMLMYHKPSYDGSAGVIGMLAVFVIIQLALILVILQVLWRRNKIAAKIVGDEEVACPQLQVEWIGFSFRLISVVAGMYCFYKIVVSLSMLINTILSYQISQGQVKLTAWGIHIYVPIILILLPAGIYLLCGAPHFVRWQTRKTLKMCTHTAD